MKVIITGSTGMVGKGVLLECLEDPKIKSIVVINRRSLNITHEKLQEIICADFHDLSSIEKDLKGVDSCYFCLGVSLGVSLLGMSEAYYSKITYDITIHFAQTLHRLNPQIKFSYVSGAGIDNRGFSKTMWARVKTKTENELLNIFQKNVFLFRPAFIQPMKGVYPGSRWYQTFYALCVPLSPFVKKYLPQFFTSSVDLGKAMLYVTTHGSNQQKIENRDINLLSDQYSLI